MVRAKIYVSSIEKSRNWRNEPGTVGDTVVTFGFAYRDDPNHENRRFWEATPSGTLQLRLSGKAGADAIRFFEDVFNRGAEMYLDFQEAPSS